LPSSHSSCAPQLATSPLDPYGGCQIIQQIRSGELNLPGRTVEVNGRDLRLALTNKRRREQQPGAVERFSTAVAKIRTQCRIYRISSKAMDICHLFPASSPFAFQPLGHCQCCFCPGMPAYLRFRSVFISYTVHGFRRLFQHQNKAEDDLSIMT